MPEDQSGGQSEHPTILPPPPPSSIAAQPASPQPKRWLRRSIKSLGWGALILLIVMGAGVGGAEYYTSRPTFCGSCHIMDPYYESWSNDLHGAKLDVLCVECHYAPGEQHTIMAKFRGLSQAMSYFSGRAGKSRPRAHVADASCLTSGCHGDGAFLTKTLTIGEPGSVTRVMDGREIEVERKPTVSFIHARHLKPDSRLTETISAMDRMSNALKSALGTEAFERVKAAAGSIEPAVRRESAMRALLAGLGAAERADDAVEFMRLEHMRLRLNQLEGLNCAACHTYNATGTHHFSVDHQACFTCHFTGQTFNRDTGDCLKCHEPPARMVLVHGDGAAAGRAEAGTATGVPAMMDHRDIIKRGIDCASCHLDVIQGEAVVTARDCTHCHDQDSYLKDFDARTTETVEEYHRIHVAKQHAQCNDCHHAIEHRLIEPALVAASDKFLRPVLEDCQHCHPRHHQEQVHLLMGIGGAGTAHAMPNAMFGSRLNCRACHTQEGSDFKGDALIEATEATCVACHSADYKQLFNQWISELESQTKETEAVLKQMDAEVARFTAGGRPLPAEVADLAEQAQHNLRLVRAGNGVHNKNYALQLLELSTSKADRAISLLSGTN